MDHVVRRAIACGLPPVTAIQMATLNTARYFMLNDHGAIAPGYFADMVAFESLTEIRVKKVFKNGELVASDGRPGWNLADRPRMALRGSVNIKWLEGDELRIPARTDQIRVIDLCDDQLLTGQSVEPARVEQGLAQSDPERDILKLTVIERHQASGKMGFGFVRGFGLRHGAMASTIAHDSHNIIVVGTNDQDMMAAVIQLNKLGGGLVFARDGEVVAELPLSVAGLMSRLPLEQVHQQQQQLLETVHAAGARQKDPYMALSFLALPVIPQLKLTDHGLVDVQRFQHVDLFVD